MHRVIAGSVLSAAMCLGATGLLSPAVATAQPVVDLPEIPIPQPDAQQRAAIFAAVLDATGVLINEVAAIVLDGEILAPPAPDASAADEVPTIELPSLPPAVGLSGSVLPLDTGSYRLSSFYGSRNNPTGPGVRFHNGLDFAADSGAPIYAVTGGTVTQAGDAGDGYGRMVRIKSGATETYYAHASSVNVAVGDTVVPGDVIAEVGNTGNSTGPHLHFEVRNNGSSIDPVPYLKALGLDPSLYQTVDRS